MSVPVIGGSSSRSTSECHLNFLFREWEPNSPTFAPLLNPFITFPFLYHKLLSSSNHNLPFPSFFFFFLGLNQTSQTHWVKKKFVFLIFFTGLALPFFVSKVSFWIHLLLLIRSFFIFILLILFCIWVFVFNNYVVSIILVGLGLYIWLFLGLMSFTCYCISV